MDDKRRNELNFQAVEREGDLFETLEALEEAMALNVVLKETLEQVRGQLRVLLAIIEAHNTKPDMSSADDAKGGL